MLNRCSLVALVLTLLLCGSSPQARAATGGPPTRYVMENGMVVILEENHDMPWVSVNLFVRSGGRWEDPKTMGLSHFCEHMFFRGTTHRTGAEVKGQIEALGGQTNAETSKDFTHFFVNAPSCHVAEILEIMADCLIDTALAPKAIDVERNAVLDEYRMDADEAMGVMQGKLFELAYKTHPYRLSVIGTEANIRRFKQADFINWYHRYYVPERTALVVVGDFDSERLRPRIQELFAAFKSAHEPVTDTQPEPPLAKTVTVNQKAPVQAGFAMIGFRAPPVGKFADVCAVDLLTFLVGQGKSSLLHTALVTHRELAQMVSFDYLTQRDEGLIILSVAATGPRLSAATTAALDILADVRNGKFTDKDLEQARTRLLSEYSLGNESDAGEAGTLGFYEMLDHPEGAERYADEVRRVKREAVIDAARRFLGGSYVEIFASPYGTPPPGASDANLPKPSTTVK